MTRPASAASSAPRRPRRSAVRRPRRSLRLRLAVVVALVVAATGTGTGTGWALWSATQSQTVTATLGKTAAAISGATPRSVTFTDRGVGVVTSVVVRNAGTVPAAWTLTPSLPAGATTASRALAEAVTVQTWAKGAAACATTAPSGALSGTWAAPPVPRGSLPAASEATWCVLSTPTSSAPAGTTVNPILTLTVSAGGSWTASSEIRDLYQNTPTAWPIARVAAQCFTYDVYYARLRFDPSARPLETTYAPFVGTRRVGTDQQSGHYPEFAFTREVLPADPYGDGRITVDLRVVKDGVPGDVAATGVVVAGRDANGLRNIQCA